MHKLTIDQTRNLLVLKMSGRISEIEAEKIFLKLKNGCAKLKPGFFIINDFSAVQDSPAKKILKDLLLALRDQKVGKVLRVVGGSRVALLEFAKSSKGLVTYPVEYVGTYEEALAKIPEG